MHVKFLLDKKKLFDCSGHNKNGYAIWNSVGKFTWMKRVSKYLKIIKNNNFSEKVTFILKLYSPIFRL